MPLGGMAMVFALLFAGLAQAQPEAAAAASTEGALPNLSFTPDAEIEGAYFKYFYFHRAETDEATAYADLRECDDYTRDLAFTASYPGGGILGGIMANAIYGSAERRMQRRVIMRTCMGFKGYAAFGLRKDLWEAFHFDEGNDSPPETRRQEFLRIQARVASGPRPAIGELPQRSL